MQAWTVGIPSVCSPDAWLYHARPQLGFLGSRSARGQEKEAAVVANVDGADAVIAIVWRDAGGKRGAEQSRSRCRRGVAREEVEKRTG